MLKGSKIELHIGWIKLQWSPTVDSTSIFLAAGIARAALFPLLKGPIAFMAFAGMGYSVLFTMVFELSLIA